MTGETVLVSAQSHLGGIAEHAHYQAQELARRGCRVVVLCHDDYLQRPSTPLYYRLERLRRTRRTGRAGRVFAIAALVWNHWVLAWHVARLRPGFVLMDCATEWFAPLWAWPHLLLRARGQVYLANLHDPVRLRHFGPAWFHRLSVRLMYAMLDGALVHGPVPPEAGIPPRLAVLRAPLGLFDELPAAADPAALRRRLAIPAEAPLVLAFGHVADRKNLDLLIAALAPLPGVHLLVAGSAPAQGQKQVADYRAQAEALGLAARVHFDERYIAEAEIPGYFAAADLVALTYSGAFVSQSGVLQHAAAFRRPVLVSCGHGPLRETLERFPLGVLVEPDSAPAITRGLAQLLERPVDRTAAFAAYARSASWPANIDQLLALARNALGRADKIDCAPPPNLC